MQEDVFILDTDIGDDIDDAYALDFALRERLPLLCVTTVYRDVCARARIAKKMLKLAGSPRIPVYAGYGATLDGKNERFPLCQATPDLSDPAYEPNSVDPTCAVSELIQAAMRWGKHLKILAIGPLTNLAYAIRRAPDAMRKIGGIIMMGGDFTEHYIEWNILCDVTAAKEVFASDVPITAFGHEVTTRTLLPEAITEQLCARTGSPYKDYLAELTRLWRASKDPSVGMRMHDVLVARYAADPTFCRMTSAPVELIADGRLRGMTFSHKLSDRQEGNGIARIRYACGFDPAEFLQWYSDSLGIDTKKE